MMYMSPERRIRERLSRWADFALGVFIVFAAAYIGGAAGAATFWALWGGR